MCTYVSPFADCKGPFLTVAVAASYLQYQGTSHGFYFDPNTVPNLAPMINNPGFQEALRFWHEVTPYTNRVKTCAATNADFQAGRCLMTVNW